MSLDTRKTAESLSILNSQADAILAAVYNAKHLINPQQYPVLDSVVGDQTDRTVTPKQEQPRLFVDSAYQAVNKAFLKKFPEVPDLNKVSGYQNFVGEGKTLQEELKYFYYLLGDVVEFTEVAQQVLLSCDKLSGLNSGSHFLITNQFLSLLCKFTVLHLQLGDASSDKQLQILAASYNQLYYQEKGAPEPLFNRIAKYLTDFDKPLLALQEIFAPLSVFISMLIQSLAGEFLRWGMISVEMLRKDNAFNVFHQLKLAATGDDKKLRLVHSFNDYNLQVIVCYLVIPGELLKQQSNIDILKTSLAQNVHLNAIRSAYFNIVSEYETAAKLNSKHSKLKSIVSESFGTQLSKSVTFHYQRREYLRFYLKQILNAVEDRPFLLGPKMPVIESLVSLATEELIWYLNHMDRNLLQNLPKVLSKQIHQGQQQQQPVDLGVSELLCVIIGLRDQVVKHRDIVHEFYVNQIKQEFSPKVEAILAEIYRQNAPSDAVTKAFQMISEELKNPKNMASLRLNFQRLLVHFHSPDTTVAVSTVPDFINVMNDVYVRSRFIDGVAEEEMVKNLKMLYYYRPLLTLHYIEAYKNNSLHIRNVFIYPDLASREFLKNVSTFYPRELDRIVQRTQYFTEEFLLSFSQTCSNFVHAVGNFQLRFGQQLHCEQAAMFVPDRRKEKAKQKKDNKEDKEKPGHESQLRSYQATTGNLLQVRTAAASFLRAISFMKPYRIFDLELFPEEYLREALIAKIKSFIMGLSVPDEIAAQQSSQQSPVSPSPQLQSPGGDEVLQIIKRPSVFLAELQAYLSAFATFDDCSVVDFSEIITDILLEQLDLGLNKKLNVEMEAIQQQSKKKKQKQPQQVQQTFVMMYAQWYSDLIRINVLNGNTMLSPLRKAIITNPTSASVHTIQSFLYTNPAELLALVQVIGPSGVRFLDDKLTQQAFQYVKEIKDIIVNNQELLQIVQKQWQNEVKFDEVAKKVKQLDELAKQSIALGYVLHFRQLVFEALQNVFDSKCGFLFQSVKNTHMKYPPNIYSVPEFLILDNLANYLGMTKNVDTLFRFSMQGHCRSPHSDNQIYQLIPYIYAILIKQLALDEKSVLNTQLDVLENNSHCLATAIQMQLTYLISITAPNDMDGLLKIQKDFIQITSTVLLRQSLAGNNQNLDSMKSVYLLLLKFVESGAFLTEDVLEEFFPYSIIRCTYSDFFRRNRGQMRRQKEEEVV